MLDKVKVTYSNKGGQEHTWTGLPALGILVAVIGGIAVTASVVTMIITEKAK